MTPLLTALSSLVDATARAAFASSALPASAASRNLRIAVLNSDLIALLRSVAKRFVLIRLSWDLMFATCECFLCGRYVIESSRRTSGPDVGTSLCDPRWVVLRCAHDLKRARKDQSYQRGTRPAKTSDAAGRARA